MNSDFSVKDNAETGTDEAPAPDAFAYFVDPAELEVLKPSWPVEIRLIVCMDAFGLCEFVVFHEEEEDSVMGRVAEILDRAIGAFAVSPYLEGHPRRSLLFSEENALLKSIQRSSSLEEIATDYLINFNFAREEGLDFDKLMRTRPEAEVGQSLRVTTDKIFPLGAKNARKKRKEKSGPPEGYAPVDEVVSEECFYLSLEMWLVGGRARIASGGDTSTSIVPMLAREIAFRDDFTSVYIPRSILPNKWAPKDNLVIDIPVELFPAGFADSFGRRKVQVAVMPRGIFVEFGAQVPVPEQVEDEALTEALAMVPRKPSRRGLFLKNLHIPLIAVTGLGVTGLFSTIIAQTSGVEEAAQADPVPALHQTAEKTRP